jgi:Family of unknown function (DUF5985)
MLLILLGAVAMASFTISLFFIRFWRLTRDTFFLFFAAAFFVEGAERLLAGVIPHSDAQEPVFYGLRLLSFMIIMYAVISKNRAVGKEKAYRSAT